MSRSAFGPTSRPEDSPLRCLHDRAAGHRPALRVFASASCGLAAGGSIKMRPNPRDRCEMTGQTNVKTATCLE
jgi:hypothetical protein